MSIIEQLLEGDDFNRPVPPEVENQPNGYILTLKDICKTLGYSERTPAFSGVGWRVRCIIKNLLDYPVGYTPSEKLTLSDLTWIVQNNITGAVWFWSGEVTFTTVPKSVLIEAIKEAYDTLKNYFGDIDEETEEWDEDVIDELVEPL